MVSKIIFIGEQQGYKGECYAYKCFVGLCNYRLACVYDTDESIPQCISGGDRNMCCKRNW